MILQTYQEKPDYARCVSIVASASLREMIKPGALAVISPIVLGKRKLNKYTMVIDIDAYSLDCNNRFSHVVVTCCFHRVDTFSYHISFLHHSAI